MSPSRNDEAAQTGSSDRTVDRRRFLAVGAGVGATLLAGCTGDGSPIGSGSTKSTSTSPNGDVGQFRLLISDQPADIGDFDELTVTLSEARVFREGDDEDEDGDAVSTTTTTNATTTNATTADASTTAPTTSEAEDADDAEEPEDDERGYFTIDLDGATVDLTQVIGEKAIEVFDDDLPTGRYTKMELYASDVVGIVEGEEVDVKIPSEKLQLTKPFEVTADEPVSFVFDINVVKKGNTSEYNLLPVISESGVAGKDVQVQEVEAEQERAEEQEQEGDAENESTTTEAAGNGTENQPTTGTEPAE